MSEILPIPQAEIPPINIGGVSVLIREMRKEIMEDENYTEEVGMNFKLIGKEIEEEK